MGVSVAIVQGAAPTGGGTQDLSVSGFGTPKAALFLVTLGAVNGTAVGNATVGIGATDGTNDRVAAMWSKTNTGTTNCRRAGLHTACVLLLRNNGGVNGQAQFVQWLANGVQINWTNAPSAAVLVTAVLFGGSDLSAFVGSFVSSTFVDDTIQVTDPSFEPAQLICFSQRSPTPDTGETPQKLSLGFVDNGAAISQGSLNWFARDRLRLSVRASDVRAYMSTAYPQFDVSRDDLQEAVEITRFPATGQTNGFDVTTRLQAESGAVMYLALGYGGVVDHWVGGFNSPTATGSHTVTAPGFTPQFVMQIMSHLTGVDAVDNSGDAGAIAVGVLDATSEFCHAVADEDAEISSADTQSLTDSKAVNFPKDDGAAGFVGTFVSPFGATGWTINYTTVQGTVRKFLGLAIGETSGIGIAVAPLVGVGSLLTPTIVLTGLPASVDAGLTFLFTASEWAGTKFFFEATGKSVSGSPFVELFTGGSPVTGSKLTFTASTFTRLRTASAITLVDGSEYVARASRPAGESGEIKGARLIPE